MNRTGEYALQALIFLAQHIDRWPIPGREIAKHAGIPAKYLQKILGDLTRAGVLASAPGRNGGFQLCRPGNRISLFDVLKPFERVQRARCPFGNKTCSDRKPCRAHHEWKKVLDTEQRFLMKMTIADVADPAKPRRRARKP